MMKAKIQGKIRFIKVLGGGKKLGFTKVKVTKGKLKKKTFMIPVINLR